MTLSIPSLERPGGESGARSWERAGEAPAPEAHVSEKGSLKDWLVSFYLEHNPEKLGSIDALLAKYATRENDLVRKLERKYEGRRDGRRSSDQRSNPGSDGGDEKWTAKALRVWVAITSTTKK